MQVGLGTVAIRTIVRKLPNLLGMSAKELMPVEETIRYLQEIIFEGIDIPEHKRSAYRSVLTKSVSTYPRVLVEGKNLHEFHQHMKENDYSNEIMSKVRMLGHWTGNQSIEPWVA